MVTAESTTAVQANTQDQAQEVDPHGHNDCSSSILVVDDEPMIRELLTDFLQEQGYECESAASGESALRQLQEKDFALLVTDMSMPGLTGLDLLSYVANNRPDMAVIVITAIYDLGTAVDSMKLGAYAYITKPFELEKALQTIDEALKRREEKLRSYRVVQDVKV
jgi:DNA-binding NtrC family response regulator